jgi:murein DD-endopeptidase MepM/ murein hydrolase activator NlpD
MIKNWLAIMSCFLLLLLPSTAFAMTVTSPFGWREHPILGGGRFHNGIDIAGDEGASIPAIWAGQVVYADWYEGFGNTVILYHGGTVYTLYGHCSSLLVNVGETAEQGKVIALVGSTGMSTGPHLHLSLIQNQEYIDPMAIWQ